ncbi:hypothetical protein QJS04_geneDACA020585 [Acorus gramineus]|uniref:Transposase-associated domain-containing protein n=1 Tax=Acorus gramineus TaxID=55184 RepID=A0AAV9BTF0_ACOGR|nr:hypothetical protein QJS04_geneDACA020585 [Acorus gramineus]
MDKSWMFNRDRRSDEFRAGVASFLKVARNCPAKKKNEAGHIRCPCQRCGNKFYFSLKAVERHLYQSGIMSGYTTWISHGEVVPPIHFPKNNRKHNLRQPTGVDEEEDEEYEDVMAPFFEDLINPMLIFLFGFDLVPMLVRLFNSVVNFCLLNFIL